MLDENGNEKKYTRIDWSNSPNEKTDIGISNNHSDFALKGDDGVAELNE